jgi:sterol desaturase/sphingolipid hydroxylase (fatty acid hydroxylase superfamily)
VQYALAFMVCALAAEFGLHPERFAPRTSLVSLCWLLASFPVVRYTGRYELSAFEWAASHSLTRITFGGAALVVLDDFLHYWVHRGAHYYRVAWWAAHRVHHSSTDFNLLVAVRFSFVGHLTGAFAPWLALVAAGFPLEQVIAVRAWNMVYQWLCHVRWGSGLPRWVSSVFVTGETHALHHASNRCYWDGNFGAMFSFWDRWFGTALRERPCESLSFGVRK